MKSTAIGSLVVLNLLLLALLVGRSMKPNEAEAQAQSAARPGDYTIIPVDFPGANVGSVVVLDNVSGQMSALQTDESAHRMVSLPRVNVADLFDAAVGRRRTPAR